jgi:hypothetical protein
VFAGQVEEFGSGEGERFGAGIGVIAEAEGQ